MDESSNKYCTQNKWDSEDEDKDTLLLIKEDIGRQLGLASERQNAMLQSIGILLAFASILFLQIIIMNPSFSGYGLFFVVSIICVLFCCVLGVSVLSSSAFSLSSGMDIEEEINLYRKGELDDLGSKIVNGMHESQKEVCRYNVFLINVIRCMVVPLLIGILTMLAGWCLT